MLVALSSVHRFPSGLRVKVAGTWWLIAVEMAGGFEQA